jgi:hypothetical protein
LLKRKENEKFKNNERKNDGYQFYSFEELGLNTFADTSAKDYKTFSAFKFTPLSSNLECFTMEGISALP